MERKICCFCEEVHHADATFCMSCYEYKGLMTISEFEKTYGTKVAREYA